MKRTIYYMILCLLMSLGTRYFRKSDGWQGTTDRWSGGDFTDP